MQGALDSIPGQYSCLENSMDSGAWRATVYGIVKSDTTEHSCAELDPTCCNSTDWTKSGTWHTDPPWVLLKITGVSKHVTKTVCMRSASRNVRCGSCCPLPKLERSVSLNTGKQQGTEAGPWDLTSVRAGVPTEKSLLRCNSSAPEMCLHG